MPFGCVPDLDRARRLKRDLHDRGTMTSSCAFLLLIAGFIWHPAHAAPLYKWADRSGRVTYSSLPPPAGIQAETVRIPPPPSADETRQAEARARKAAELASEIETQRRKQEAEEARLRAMQPPPVPVVIEKPVYVPQPIYYPPVRMSPRRHPRKPVREQPR